MNIKDTVSAGNQIIAPPAQRGSGLLAKAALAWFSVAVVGQWIFAYYLIALYGRSAVRGEFEAWNTFMPHGYVSGDTMGNLAVAVHILLAFIILVLAPLQFSAQLRARLPLLHRINGRIYMFTAFAISLDGLYMIFIRGSASGPLGAVSISINAVLIMVFGYIALRHAMARRITRHRRWILRLFMAVSGVWFFRIGLMLWLFIHGGPVGFDMATFRGPFLDILAFAQYLLPLAVLELFFWAESRAGQTGSSLVAAFIFLLTGIMAVGIFATTMGMWLPHF